MFVFIVKPMFKKVSIILFTLLFLSCEKQEVSVKEIVGTFKGKKTTYYSSVNYVFTDTITIDFVDTKYTYSGLTYTHPPDFGSGMYFIKNDSIEFNDVVARNALLTWDWIIGGMYKMTLTADSLILTKDFYGILQTCRLKEVK